MSGNTSSNGDDETELDRLAEEYPHGVYCEDCGIPRPRPTDTDLTCPYCNGQQVASDPTPDVDTKQQTDCWDQPVEYHDADTDAGVPVRCLHCDSEDEVALVGGTIRGADGDKFEEYYECQNCGADGTFHDDTRHQMWLGGIENPDSGQDDHWSEEDFSTERYEIAAAPSVDDPGPEDATTVEIGEEVPAKGDMVRVAYRSPRSESLVEKEGKVIPTVSARLGQFHVDHGDGTIEVWSSRVASTTSGTESPLGLKLGTAEKISILKGGDDR